MTAYTVRYHPPEWYVAQLQQRQPFSLSRWGDGEWRAVFLADTPNASQAKSGANCDKHRYFPTMNRQLADILKSQPPYRLGLQSLAIRLFGDKLVNYIQRYLPGREWHDAAEVSRAGYEGRLAPILKAIGDMPHIVVGPYWLKGLYPLFPVHRHVKVPHLNCFLHLDRIVRETRETLRAASQPCVVTFAASMPANIMIHQLYEEFGKTSFLLDVGSTYDGLLGVLSRSGNCRWNNKANLEGLK